jgi:hypothetical protein
MAESRTQVPHMPGEGLRYDIRDAETESTRAGVRVLMLVRDGERAPRTISAGLHPSNANATGHAVCAARRARTSPRADERGLAMSAIEEVIAQERWTDQMFRVGRDEGERS